MLFGSAEFSGIGQSLETPIAHKREAGWRSYSRLCLGSGTTVGVVGCHQVGRVRGTGRTMGRGRSLPTTPMLGARRRGRDRIDFLRVFVRNVSHVPRATMTVAKAARAMGWMTRILRVSTISVV